ncbi:HlyD family secretion protein [Methylomarinovum caldicuralii]|uniref:HlyD family secretion protein n=1 Tax=Methylomarinovum caldicuralii TaxID=438856 RepID=A0AAU9BTL3_9GAMM|nr:efflux RND transporter periplasmic adaptor subunit [Methylomarinovum caldicuralii]BCX81956.1 HlyD family secretion protein [Methylomarinovum caldicuralii]
MSRKTKILVSLAILLGLSAYAWYRHDGSEEADGGLTLYGNIALRQIDLAVNGSERLTKVLLWEGDRVRPGQLMAQLDLEPFQAEVARLEAEVATQKAVVEKLENGSRPQEIERARAQLAEAKALEQDAWITYRRLKKLLPRKLVSPEEVDNAKAKAEAASARRRAAEQNLSLAIEGPRREDKAAARARLKSLQAQLALAKHNLRNASLYAPAAGIVRDRILEPGDLASPQRPVYTLALTDPLWARVYVDEPDLGKLKLGMRAEITTDSFPDKRYPGWVGYISPSAEFTPKTVQTEKLRTHLVYQVRVFACNPEGELRLGMPVTVRIPLPQTPDARKPIPCRQPQPQDGDPPA